MVKKIWSKITQVCILKRLLVSFGIVFSFKNKVGFIMIVEPSIPIHEVIYRSIRLRIMLGQIEPGTTFSIRSLAKEFSVSMTPIRDATRRLVAEGALIMSSTGRISAPRINSIRIQELLSLRLLLEPELAIRAIPRVHSALIERLSNIQMSIDEMIKSQNPLGYLKTNLEFHKTLYLRAQAPAMLAILETVWLQSGPTMILIFKRNCDSFSTFCHRNILLALKSGNKVDLAENIKVNIKNNFKTDFD